MNLFKIFLIFVGMFLTSGAFTEPYRSYNPYGNSYHYSNDLAIYEYNINSCNVKVVNKAIDYINIKRILSLYDNVSVDVTVTCKSKIVESLTMVQTDKYIYYSYRGK